MRTTLAWKTFWSFHKKLIYRGKSCAAECQLYFNHPGVCACECACVSGVCACICVLVFLLMFARVVETKIAGERERKCVWMWVWMNYAGLRACVSACHPILLPLSLRLWWVRVCQFFCLWEWACVCECVCVCVCAATCICESPFFLF